MKRLDETADNIFANRPDEPSPFVCVVIVSVLFFLLIWSYVSCGHAQGQERTKVFGTGVASQQALAVHPRVSSVFGSRFPELQPTQILIVRHLYIAAIDPQAKQPAWIAYRVQRSDWDTRNKLDRHFHTPDALKPFCLEADDFRKSGFELGHMYGLQFVLASQHADEVNEMSIIAAQRPALNKGPWLDAENRVKKSSESNTVTVMTGLLWRESMPSLMHADEPHRVASHCWMILHPGPGGKEEAYLMPQSAGRGDDCSKFAIVPDDLRSMVSDSWLEGIAE